MHSEARTSCVINFIIVLSGGGGSGDARKRKGHAGNDHQHGWAVDRGGRVRGVGTCWSTSEYGLRTAPTCPQVEAPFPSCTLLARLIRGPRHLDATDATDRPWLVIGFAAAEAGRRLGSLKEERVVAEAVGQIEAVFMYGAPRCCRRRVGGRVGGA